MVRPSAESYSRPLTDSESIEAGDGTTVGDDGIDIDGGGPGGGVADPPIADIVKFIPDSSVWDGVLDFAVASIWDITLGDDLTGMTFANPPAVGLDGKMEVTYRQPSSGGPFTVDQPAPVLWRADDGTGTGTAPVMPTADASTLVVVYDVRDGGTVYGGTTDGGSVSEEDFVAHGAMGTTETFDPADGSSHYGTLDDDCTATITAPAGDGPIQMEWWITNDGVHTFTIIAAGGGSVTNDTVPDTTDGVTNRYILDRIPATTNDWVVDLVGSAASVASIWVPVMVEDAGTGLWYVMVTGDGDAVMTEVPL